MIMKLFKTILVLSLCLGISIPSNAAVSVSDGSAFVTNAEFNSDVNNLENRMASLENSIDAKIDSLVSSYLTRNGIWNGVKQELTDAVKDKKEHSFKAAFTAGNRGTKAESIQRIKEVIVAKTSKAGMAFGSFSYGNQHKGNPNNWYYGIYNNSADQPGWIWDQNMCITLSFFETEENVTLNFDTSGNPTNGTRKSVVEIGKCLGLWNWESNRQILLAIPLPNWNTVPFLFFVEKDKSIWWRWLDEMSTYQIVAAVNTPETGSTIRLVLNEFSIY